MIGLFERGQPIVIISGERNAGLTKSIYKQYLTTSLYFTYFWD